MSTEKPKLDVKEIIDLHRIATEQKRELPWVFVLILMLVVVYSLLFMGMLSSGPYVVPGPAQHLRR